MTINARPAAVTQPLPNFNSAAATRAWLASLTAEPRRRHPRSTASLAATDRIPVFGGDEVR